MSESTAIDLDDVHRAAERIAPFARRTPVIESTRLNERVGAQVFAKAENLQRTGAFKFRGATNAIAAMSDADRARGVVTFSSGNHGQAISRAAGLHGVNATVVMPTDAPPIKRTATEHWGARIVDYDRYEESREAVAEAISTETGAMLVLPYDNPFVVAGQGTTALELVTEVPHLDLLFVCVGGGGLLAGCAIAATALNPDVRLIGVEPEASDDHVRSRAAGRRVTLSEIPRTIADGQQLSSPGVLTWPITNALTERFVTVTDDEIVATMRLLFLHHKLVVEPSGASALAAVLHRDLVEPGMRVGVTLSGGNVGLDRFIELVG